MGYLDVYNKLKAEREEEMRKLAEKAQKATSRSTSESHNRMGVTVSNADAKEKAEKEKKWFNSGLFEDGYQFGDISKTLLGTGADLAEDALTGIVGMGEKVVDFGAYIAPYVAQGQFYQNGGAYQSPAVQKTQNEMFSQAKKESAEFIKKDLYDENAIAKRLLSEVPGAIQMSNINQAGGFATTQDWERNRQMQKEAQGYLDNTMEDVSVLGDKSDALVQSAGQLVATAGLQTVGVPWWMTTGATSFGSETENALNQGATYEEAGLSAAITAGAEILTEKISGGIKFGGKTLDEGATRQLSRVITNKLARNLSKIGMDVVGEGGEEVLSGYLSAIGQKLTYADEKEMSELFSSEDALDAFIGGAILGGVSSTGQAINETVKGNDYASGLTNSEKAVVDKVYKDAVAEKEADGKKLSQSEKSKIYDDTLLKLERGYIDTDTIESVIGGETYNTYKSTVESEDALQKEYDELYHMKNGEKSDAQRDRQEELKKQLDELKTTSKRTQLKEQLDNEVLGLVQGSKLSESYNEKNRRSQVFEADLTQYDSKQAEVVKKAVESGILNNTNKTHDFVDMIAKVSAEKGVSFDFMNNKKLKESGFAVEGKTVNGFVKDGNVTLNIDSAKSLNTVVGHEITHVLEGTEFMPELQTVLFELAKTKGEYDTRLQALTKLYEGVEGANVEAELTADLVGDYLFTDADFINNLSTGHRNVFQKIYDEIKYLYKVATAGSKEARELEKVKKAFEKAYKESGKAATDTKYSIGEIVDENNKSYGIGVHLDSTLLDNLTAKERVEMIKEYVKELGGQSFNAYDPQGHETAIKIIEYDKKFKNANGKRVPVNKNLTTKYIGNEVKQESITLIDELISTAEYESGKAPNYTHDWLDNNGTNDWEYWTTFVEDKNNTIWEVTLNVANTANGEKALYDITPIKKVGQSGKSDTSLHNNSVPQDSEKSSGDVQYSISDSDGKQLTKEQQNYFKDSKVRDENGNLKVMYHGTERDGGFTVFNNEFSDDGNSFFFSDNNTVAKSYSGTYSDYAPRTFASVDEVNNEIRKDLRSTGYHIEEENGEYVLYYENDEMESSSSLDELYRTFEDGYGRGLSSTNYKVYLNLKNPLIVDAKNNNWNEISSEFSQEIYDRYNSLTDDEKSALISVAEWDDIGIFRDELQRAKSTSQDEHYRYLASAYEKMGGEDTDFYGLFDVATEGFTEESINKNAIQYLKTRDYAHIAKEQGYDGVIFNNIADNGLYASGMDRFLTSTVAIAFDSNQIKSVDNANPTSDPDIRYSLSEDNQGRKLSDGQKEYFKDSKVVDENGKLKLMYHGTAEDFTVFNPLLKGGKNGTAEGYGIYFADTKLVSDAYGGRVMSGYLNITRPATSYNKTIKKSELVKLIKTTCEIEAQRFVDDGDYDNLKDALRDTWISDYVYTYDMSIGEAYKQVAENILSSNSSDMDIVQEVMNANGIRDYESAYKFYDVLKSTLGIDGFITEWENKNVDVYSKIAIAFDSKQFKNVDNLHPTDDEDVRKSLSENDIAPSPYGSYNVFGKDIALEQDIAPVEEIAPTTEEIGPLAEVYAPLTEEEANVRDDEQIDSKYFLDQMAPEPEAPIYNEDAEPESPFDERDFDSVGSQKVKAYMYENPEVKPFFQEEARNMLFELDNSVKGERVVNANMLYESGGEYGVYGTKRLTSEAIAYLRDSKYQYTYDQIRKGLNAIIEDHGAENNAISKRIEFLLDERLREGYTDTIFTGEKIPPNQEYLNLLTEKQITEYNDEAWENFVRGLSQEDMQQYFGNEEDIAPPVETKNTVPIEDAPIRDDLPLYEDNSGQQSMFEVEDANSKRVNDFLQTERTKVTEAYEQKKAELQGSIPDQNTYRSNKALELYSEISNLGKGIKASEQLGYLLDYGYPWYEVKKALRNIWYHPNERVDVNSIPESVAREMIDKEYERESYALDDLEAEYKWQLEEVEAKAEEMRNSEVEDAETEPTLTRSVLHGNIITNIKNTFAEKGFDLDNVLKKAKDLSTFATVDNTPQRVMEKALGYKQGQVLSDLTVNQVAQNETEGTKWLDSFTNRKNGLLAQIAKDYNINLDRPHGRKKSAAAQMYAEGFYVDEDNNIIAYGNAELEKDFPNYSDRADIRGLARDPRIRKIYDDTLAMINESRKRNAYPEIPRLDNYFLHFRAMDDTFSRLGLPFNPNDIRAKDLPTDLNGVTADLKPGQPYFASAMHRTGKRTSFDLLGGLERYLSSAKNQIYHIDDIQTLRALRNYIADTYGQAKGLESLDALTEEEAQERIEEVYGSHLSTFAKFLNEEANVLAGKTSLIDRGLEGVIGRRGITFLDTVNKQVGANMVGFNISSSLTNFLPVTQTFAKTNKADFVKAFAQTVSNKIGSVFGRNDGFAEQSPVMIRRKGADRFYRTPWQKAGDVGYVFMSAVDSISTELVTRTKYNELIRKGMNPQKAHYETDKWVSRMMGDRSLGQQPQLYNSKMLGLFTKFQLEVRNQLDSQFYDTIQEAKVSNEDIKNGLARNAKTAAKVGATFLQLAVVQHLFGKAFESVAGYNPAFDIIAAILKAVGYDDDEESEDTVLDNIEQGFLELLGDLPYTSTFTGGRIPISSALPVEQFVTGKDDYGNEKSRWETIKETAPYYVLPAGYGQIKKTYQGLSMFDDDLPIAGSYTDSGNLRFPVEDTLPNRVQAGIFGQWASDNARDYFDNERNPLKEKQIEELVDLDLPIADYWKYREGLAEQETLEDKFDYIAGLDASVEQKNIMINNIVDRKEKVDMSNYDDFSGYEEFDFYAKNTDKYNFLEENGVSYAEYISDEDMKKEYDNAYSWYKNNPEKVTVSKAITDNVIEYRRYTSELNDIRADKDADGDSISGSAKAKKVEYINNLDLDYGQKIILFRSMYSGQEDKDTYNAEIVEYLNKRDDISYGEMLTILEELDMIVLPDGTVVW